MNNFHKASRRLCAVAIGLVFFVSGTIKIIDPVGVSLIVEEYFKFLHLGFLAPASRLFAVGIPLMEIILGAGLLAGIMPRVFALASAVTIGFFSLISILLVVFNPEMNCGCFGEAIPLTHTQTLLKNIILAALWLLAFIPFRDFPKAGKSKRIAFIAVSFLTLILAVRSNIALPAVDFTAFARGADIYMGESYADSLIQEDPLLGLSNAEGEYCDSVVYEGRIMLISVYKAEKLKAAEWKHIADYAMASNFEGFTSILAVSCSPEQMQTILQAPELGHEASFILESCLYYADYKTLVTLNRSNGGATYIYNGSIIEKWSRGLLPSGKSLKRTKAEEPVELLMRSSTRGRLMLESVALYSIAALLLL